VSTAHTAADITATTAAAAEAFAEVAEVASRSEVTT
jgi:hypothetical protein